MKKVKLKKGDTVIVLAGKDKGKVGEIITVFPKINKVVIKAINIKKKHQKPSANSEGGIVSIEHPIDVSNVAFYDVSGKFYSKLGFKLNDSGVKTRFMKKTGNFV